LFSAEIYFPFGSFCLPPKIFSAGLPHIAAKLCRHRLLTSAANLALFFFRVNWVQFLLRVI
jgi:hypothetical protein